MLVPKVPAKEFVKYGFKNVKGLKAMMAIIYVLQEVVKLFLLPMCFLMLPTGKMMTNEYINDLIADIGICVPTLI